MANNIAVSITADVADLQVKRAIMSAELKTAQRDLSAFAKDAAVSGITDEMRTSMLASADAVARLKNQVAAADTEIKKFGQSQQAVNGMSAQNSAALKNLSFQINDVATGLATGQPPMMIFAQQGSQIVQALQMMEGGGNKFIRFLSGPWGMALTAATVVVAPFIAKLIEAKSAAEQNAEALEKVKLGDSGLGDAQRVLGEMFDLATGKIKDQNDMLRLNARLVAAKLRAEGLADQQISNKTMASARNSYTGGLSLGSIAQGALSNLLPGDLGNVGPQMAAAEKVRNLAKAVQDGTITLEEAQKRSRKIDFSGLAVSVDQFNQALVSRLESTAKIKTADAIDKTLDTGKLDKSLMKTDKKKGGGPDIVSQWAEELHAQEIASGEFFKDQTKNELSFWQGKVNLTKEGSKERLAVEARIYEASKALAQQNYQDHLATLNDRIEADRNNWAQEKADWNEKLSYIAGTFGEESAEYKNAHRELERLEREHQNRELQAAQQHATRLIDQFRREMDARIRTSNENEKINDVNIRNKAGTSLFGDVGAAVAVGQNHQAAIDEQMAANELFHKKQVDELNKQIADAEAAYSGDKSRYQNLLDAKEQADQQYYDRKAVLEAQSREQSMQSIQAIKSAYHGYIDGIVGSSVSAFDGILSGQKTWAQAGISIYSAVVGTIEQKLTQMVANWIVDHLLMKTASMGTAAASASAHAAAEATKTGATVAGISARSSAEIAGHLAVFTATRPLMAAQALSLIGLAGAGGIASMAAAPFPLDLTAPAFGASMAAAAASYATLASFDKGTNVLPNDMIAQVHAGERIVPKADNDKLIALTARGAGMGGDARGGDQHVTYAPTIIGQLPFADQLDAHESNIISMLQRAHRRGALKFGSN